MNAPVPPPAIEKTALDFPEPLEPLFRPQRYKVATGGRGGAKSWSYARALLLMGQQIKLRILCAREVMNSIDDSVHALLKDQAEQIGFTYVDEFGETKPFYRAFSRSIIGANGTSFIYAGLKHNIDSLKSKEAVDICWVEEAQSVSNESWIKLIPTIRKPDGGPWGAGAEIWASMNPELEDDATYQRFLVNTPEDCALMRINWRDNPWFPEVLYREMQHDFRVNPELAMHIWEGEPRRFLEGAIYANELRRADEEGRITNVPYVGLTPVHVFFDLGWSDLMSVWFVQRVGMNYNLIDFWQGRQMTIERLFNEVLRTPERPYQIGHFFLPHDASSGHLASGGVSVEELVVRQVNDSSRVHVLPRLDIAQGINAARTIFNQCWFDKVKCADGLQALRHYRYDVDEETKLFSKIPLHDINSHAADAFRQFAVSVHELDNYGPVRINLEPDPVEAVANALGRPRTGLGWMRR